MTSFTTRTISLKTKASVGVRAANVLKYCEMMETQNKFLKTLLADANDSEMSDHVMDSHLNAIANIIPEFKKGPFFMQPVNSTLMDPITDKISILRDFIKHAITFGMNVDYKFPEKRRREDEYRLEIARQKERLFVQRFEDAARKQELERARERERAAHTFHFNVPMCAPPHLNKSERVPSHLDTSECVPPREVEHDTEKSTSSKSVDTHQVLSPAHAEGNKHVCGKARKTSASPIIGKGASLTKKSRFASIPTKPRTMPV